MFRPKTPAVAGGPAQAPQAPGTQPGKPPASQRPGARDSRAFSPSTFATRKAENAAGPPDPGRRLVYVGSTEHRMSDIKTGSVEVVPVELYVDADHPARQFHKFPHGVIQAAYTDSRADEVTPLGRFYRNRGPASGRFPEALTDPAPRPVT